MSLLKNLMILTVLAAVGYGIYLSLSPNNTDLRSSPDETTGDLSNAKLSLTPGGPLAVDANSAGNSGTSRLISAPLAPPPLAGGLSAKPSADATNTPLAPYPACGSSTVAPLTPPACPRTA